MPTMLDLYCGRLGVGRVFAERGWDVTGIDLVEPPEIPAGVTFIKRNALEIDAAYMREFDFGWASSPCEEFSVHGMKHFHPNPKFPDMGLVLFCWTRRQFELSGIPFVMENVRAAQQFVGNAVHRCGSFHLWGNAIPALMPQGIIKGMTRKAMGQREYKGLPGWNTKNEASSRRLDASGCASIAATIPYELATCIADYAERILEVAV